MNGSITKPIVFDHGAQDAPLSVVGFAENLFDVQIVEPPDLLPLFENASLLFAMRSQCGIEKYPYTSLFDEICDKLLRDMNGAISHLLRERFKAPSLNSAMWRMLLYLRKNGLLKLGTGKRAQGVPIRFAEAEKRVMRELLRAYSRSACESLPYTTEFTDLAHRFRANSPYPPRSEAEIWRLVILIAKARRRPRHPELWPKESS